MAKIIFVNRFFYPDHSATSQILSDLAFFLAECGLDVWIVTSRQMYDDADVALRQEESIKGVRVIRIRTTTFGRRVLAGRSLDYLSFYAAALLTLLRICHRNDVVVAKTDPPLISVVCVLVTRLKRGQLINWLQDLFPEVAVGLKVGLKGGMFSQLLVKLRNISLRSAVACVAIGSGMQRRLVAQGVPDEKIEIIGNWADDAVLTPISNEQNQLRTLWGLQDKFVVGYSGNLGRAHDFETILDAAAILRDQACVRFVIIGGGAQYSKMREMAQIRGLSNVKFLPYQPREILRESLGVADLHLVMLQPEMEGLIVPSKFYGVAAVGRGTAFLGSKTGEIARLIAENDCGESFPIGDASGLAQYVARLSRDKSEVVRIGENARRAVEKNFSKQRSLFSWKRLLERVVHDPGR